MTRHANNANSDNATDTNADSPAGSGGTSDIAAPIDAIWHTRCPVPTAAGIAIQQGWIDAAFAADGIAVKAIRVARAREVRESHFVHSLENSFRQGGNAPALYARSAGADTVLLGLHWVPQYQGLLTLPGRGIASLRDIRGKRLSLPRRLNDKIDFWRSISLQGYDSALRQVGLTLADVQLVDIPVDASFSGAAPGGDGGEGDARSESPPLDEARTHAWRTGELLRQHQAETVAWLRGEVDVIFGHSVWGVALREQFSAIELINLNRERDIRARINNGQPKTLTVSRRLLETRPDLVDRYVDEVVKAAHWARAHESEARRILAGEMGATEALLDEGTSADAVRKLDISLDQPLIDALDARKDFLLHWGFIPRDFDLRAWIDPGPLQRALEKRRNDAAWRAPA